MMEIKSKAYGKVKVNEKDMIIFESGIIGFENLKKFVLLGRQEADESLVWLQSAEDEGLAFVVIQPRVFKPDYQPVVDEAKLESLSIETPDDLLVLSIVTVPDNPLKMTANLKAPIVINVKNNKGQQVVLNDDRYEIKTPVLAEK